MKVTLVPAQMLLVPAMLTLTGRLGFTVMVILLDVAGLPDTQVAFEVITQVMIFPLVNVLVV